MPLNPYQKVIQVIELIPNQRVRDVVGERFGLWDGQAKTLQAIGDKYDITRERVRQIEEAGFKTLNQEKVLQELEPVFKQLADYLIEYGNLRREDRIAAELNQTKYFDIAKKEEKFLEPALQFCLTLGRAFQRLGDNENFYSLWLLDKKALVRAQKFINSLVKHFEKKGDVISQEEVSRALKGEGLSEKEIFSYIDATKHIERNKFGQWGLADWPQIKPRGVKDKAFIIFKKAGRPLHFSEVAGEISKAFSPVNTQTVHNELIKDPRFVLVGRGLYALADWGFAGGTVRDLISEILKSNGPQSKEEILEKVLKGKLVKPNTILVNLQNSRHFKREKDGRYSLVS